MSPILSNQHIMTSIIKLPEIKTLLKSIDVVAAMEEGFIQYSNGNTVVPPVGELIFEEPKGEVHLKYGYIKNGDYYCVKIASGFYDNPKLGVAAGQGLMLLFNQETGVPESILLDEGYLTDVRTAAAGDGGRVARDGTDLARAGSAGVLPGRSSRLARLARRDRVSA